MPCYFIHLYNAHVHARDEEGHDLADMAAARAMALAGIRDFIGHEAMGGTIDFRGEVKIADVDGRVLETVPFKEAFTILGL
jgi:hypothetical protein